MTDDWREIRRDANRGIRFTLTWVGIVVLFIVLAGAAWWGIGVATSGAKGQGDAIREKNSAENWVAAQARFEDMYADIEATDRKITVAFAALQSDPENKTYQQTYLGTVNYCLEVVGDYNAEARKYLAADFRAADLPQEIDGWAGSDLDCKE